MSYTPSKRWLAENLNATAIRSRSLLYCPRGATMLRSTVATQQGQCLLPTVSPWSRLTIPHPTKNNAWIDHVSRQADSGNPEVIVSGVSKLVKFESWRSPRPQRSFAQIQPVLAERCLSLVLPLPLLLLPVLMLLVIEAVQLVAVRLLR
jgi:hypothetical protein